MIDIRRLSVALLITGALTGCGGDSPGSQAGSAAVASDQLRGAAQSSANAGSNGAVANATNDNAQVSAANNATLRLTQYVNPLIGTLASDSPNPVPAGQAGSVVPAAGLPNGMVQWAPDTNTTPAPSNSAEPGSPAGYYYDIGSIQSFSVTHMSGAGCGGNDGEFPVMPTLDATKPLAQTFNHANEKAVAGAYSVLLDNQIKVELTATLRTGFGRFTYPNQQSSTLVLDTTYTNTQTGVAGSVTQVDARTISGSTTGGHFCGNSTNVPVYFYAQFSQPFATTSSFTQGRAVMNFGKANKVLMKVGISYVSVANAKGNLDKENPSWDFDGVKALADAVWNQRLNTIQVSSQDTTALTKFYTAFYHALWAPSVFSDSNGQYIGFDQQVHTVGAGHAAQYTSFSGWDIYRSLIPLKATLFPQETSDMAQSLVNDADQCGAIPHWVNDNVEDGVMPGDAGSLIVAGAYAFGARAFDTSGALKHMIKMANVPGTACNGVTTNGGRASYLQFGYITNGEWGQASSTLEYGSSDFAISQFAGQLGNSTIQKMLLSRSAYWQNLLNTSLTPPLIAARNSDGSWIAETQSSTDNYVEGNAEQYTWMVPFNPVGLFGQLGGNTAAVSRLNTFFTVLNAGMSLPNFYMGNEPTFEVPWLYNWAGSPSGTQSVVQQIMASAFGTGPNGLPGNDDLGAVSGWYVWGALGLYPEIPGVGGLAIGSPQFASITVHLGNGKTLRINAPGAPSAKYVQSLSVNGAAHHASWLDIDALSNGATLNFVMGSSPSQWGTNAADAPPSYGVPLARNVADAFNNHGIGSDGSTDTDGLGADFDGSLYSYSSQALTTAGAAPGKPFSFGGASFVLSGGPLDNAVAVGQTIALPPGTTGRSLVLLGSANNGPSSGAALITYADGTTTPFTLSFDDWTLNGGGAAPVDPIALTTTYRNAGDGSNDGVKTYLFAQAVPLTPGKLVASVTLPKQVSAGKLHVFGISAAP
ncbi:glycoside hydrolase family 92 protein [Paraburkholderia sp. UYCP14C]|uniref:GH92 family glycosyl hydrolase n=1 Tax=Paraburkholderia sp. UYCP14C TaxID=2511130 RepID=UPI001020A2B1|nr:glycoside hydrolase family 92 protein [Paraburkholderia sp. UYCP14C]